MNTTNDSMDRERIIVTLHDAMLSEERIWRKTPDLSTTQARDAIKEALLSACQAQYGSERGQIVMEWMLKLKQSIDVSQLRDIAGEATAWCNETTTEERLAIVATATNWG